MSFIFASTTFIISFKKFKKLKINQKRKCSEYIKSMFKLEAFEVCLMYVSCL